MASLGYCTSSADPQLEENELGALSSGPLSSGPPAPNRTPSSLEQ